MTSHKFWVLRGLRGTEIEKTRIKQRMADCVKMPRLRKLLAELRL